MVWLEYVFKVNTWYDTIGYDHVVRLDCVFKVNWYREIVDSEWTHSMDKWCVRPEQVVYMKCGFVNKHIVRIDCGFKLIHCLI